MANTTKIDTNSLVLVQLLDDNRLEEELGTAYSSVMLNPSVMWAKFILTDDKVNGNGQRVPKEEFPNLIKSGVYMPLKMAEGQISDGHADTHPLGVITHLKEEGDQIVALAALWTKERPDDIKLIKQKFDGGESLNISWEILFTDMEVEDGGIQAIHGAELTAATIVGMPAYEGRTPIIAFAAKKWSPAYLNALPDSSFLYVEPNSEKDSSGKTLPKFRHFAIIDDKNNIDMSRVREAMGELSASNLPQNVLKTVKSQLTKLINMHESGASLEVINQSLGLTTSVSEPLPKDDNKENKFKMEMEEKIKELETRLADAMAKLQETQAQLAEKDKTLAEKETALAELQAYKDGVEGEKASIAKMAAIKEKFASAKIEKDEKYFEENKEKFLGLNDSELDFMIQEISAFASKSAEASQKIPFFVGEDGKLNKDALVKALRERDEARKQSKQTKK